jgi:hypothetical protein
MKIGPRSIAALGLTALACAGLAAAAFAGVHKYDTKLTIIEEQGSWHGEVKSKIGRCEVERRVVLFNQADRRLASTRSSVQGSWSLDLHRENLAEVAQAGGKYAKVRRKSGNGYVCRADRAPNHGTV